MWGCMTAQGVGHTCRIDKYMDTQVYTTILGDEFLGTIAYYGLEVSNIIFQQDSDPSTPPASPTNGSKTTRSQCWSGLRSRQT
jgi:hypothetical protein